MAQRFVDTASVVSVLDFINRIRTLQELDEWNALPLLGDEDNDVVAALVQ